MAAAQRFSLKVEVTALTGDPDVYVTVGGDDPPGPNNFYWMSGATGEMARFVAAGLRMSSRDRFAHTVTWDDSTKISQTYHYKL